MEESVVRLDCPMCEMGVSIPYIENEKDGEIQCECGVFLTVTADGTAVGYHFVNNALLDNLSVDLSITKEGTIKAEINQKQIQELKQYMDNIGLFFCQFGPNDIEFK